MACSSIDIEAYVHWEQMLKSSIILAHPVTNLKTNASADPLSLLFEGIPYRTAQAQQASPHPLSRFKFILQLDEIDPFEESIFYHNKGDRGGRKEGRSQSSSFSSIFYFFRGSNKNCLRMRCTLPSPSAGCRPGNGEKLSISQAEPGQAITLDAA